MLPEHPTTEAIEEEVEAVVEVEDSLGDVEPGSEFLYIGWVSRVGHVHEMLVEVETPDDEVREVEEHEGC